MKVSLSWLKEYVAIEMDVNSLADALTMAGLEVESVSDRFDYLDKVVVGRVVSVEPHPNADRLTLCRVDVGNQEIQIVCGAPNVVKDILVPVAMPGSVLPNGTVIKKGVIRKIESYGMICSEIELCLGTDTSGIMILDSSLVVGDKLAYALDLHDPVIEIDLTPNRPDCLSIIGIAREVALIENKPLKYPDFSLIDSDNVISDMTSVRIEAPDHCPRYAARLVKDITVGPSPFWLQDRLLSIGIRPINNIVDITNFVMMETGQPLHAFDFDLLGENRIVVRKAKQGEIFTTLDDKKRELNSEMLMICDGQKPVAIAGVMGGLNSEIKNSTKRVLIESACFDPVSIRKTSKKLGLNTEASHRFERGVDPDGTINALNRTAMLISEITGASLIHGKIDENPVPVVQKTISLNIKDVNRLLGMDVDINQIRDLLEPIEFKVQNKDDKNCDVIVPSFRVDVSIPEDIMEEIARISGYNNIKTTFPTIPATGTERKKHLSSRDRIKQLMIGFGFTETINYSFINKNSCDSLGLDSEDPKTNMVEILNPLTDDQSVMRTTMIPGLLQTMSLNISKQIQDIKIFELGNIYFSTGLDTPAQETQILAGLQTGARSEHSWHTKEAASDYYDIKGVVEGLLKSLDISQVEFIADDSCSYTRPGHAAKILVQNKSLGLVGQVNPRVLNNYNLKQPAFIFELNLDTLISIIPDIKRSKPIPKFPSTSRDITLIIDKDIQGMQLVKQLEQLNNELIESIQLLDIYEGEPIPVGKKSILIRITYRSLIKTLEDEEINRLHKEIADNLITDFNATVPG